LCDELLFSIRSYFVGSRLGAVAGQIAAGVG
jgi:hypothetical protein